MLNQIAKSLIKNEESALKEYHQFCESFKSAQKEFLLNLKYRNSSADLKRITEKIYCNDDYQSDVYIPNQFLHYLSAKNYLEIIKLINEHKWKDGFSLLDIGCGPGISSFLIKSLNISLKIEGIDISSKAIEKAREIQTALGLENMNWENISFEKKKSNQFDYILCFELLEHISNPEELLIKIKESLKPDGKLFLSCALNMESIDHIYLFENRKQIKTLLNKAGFNICIEKSTTLSHRNIPVEQTFQLLDKYKAPGSFICIAEKA